MTPAETTAILRQFNAWRLGDDDIEQPAPREIGEAIDAAVEMIERLEAAESDAAHQKALADSALRVAKEWEEKCNALRAKIEAAEKSDAESLAMYRKARDERDTLRAALQHEADCVEAAKAEIDALRNEIACVKEVEFPRKAQAVADAWKGKCKRLEVERDALRAKIAEMEQQEPARLVTPTAYRWRYRGAVKWQYGELTEETVRLAKEHNHEVQSLYALPGAQNVPTSLLVAIADLVTQMEIIARVGFVDTPNDKDSCAAFCVAEGSWLELMSAIESLASALAAAPETKP